MLVLTTALASCASPLVFNVTPVMLALLISDAIDTAPPMLTAPVNAPAPRTSSAPNGELVPIPNLLLVLSQKNVVVSPLNVLPAPAICTVPGVP